MTALLQASGVSKSYRSTPALRGVDLQIDAGEILAVTGPSGCGKSTLLHCLAGILRPDGGTIRYHGQDLTGWSETRRATLRRTEFGVLFQFGQLIAELSAVENVALPLLLAGARRREARHAAMACLDRFAVAHLADHKPAATSDGEQQRCALARAMVTNPRVLFTDEPTGALDTYTGEQVLAELVTAAREHGTAVVMVTHEAHIAAYADRELTLRDGAVDPTGLGLGTAA